MKCKICGRETRKDRPVCIGCYSLREVVKKKDKAPKSKVEKATNHLLKNPGLTIISWIIPPVHLQKSKNGGYKLKDGRHRVCAYKLLGIKSIKAKKAF